MDDDPFVISTQPLYSLGLGVQLLFRWASNSAKLSYKPNKWITAMGREVVHHVVERFGFRVSAHMSFEDADEGFGCVIGVALKGHLAIGVMEEGENVKGPIADIFKLLEALSHGVGLQVGHKSLEDLDAWTFVKEKQVTRRVSVEGNEVLHLWEEVGVSDMKKVSRPVRLQAIAFQNAMQGGLAGRHSHRVWFCLQMSRRPSQRPSSAVGQRLGLAVKRHYAQIGFFRIDGRPSRAREVAQAPCLLTTL